LDSTLKLAWLTNLTFICSLPRDGIVWENMFNV